MLSPLNLCLLIAIRVNSSCLLDDTCVVFQDFEVYNLPRDIILISHEMVKHLGDILNKYVK